jgi:hypothetical protein
MWIVGIRPKEAMQVNGKRTNLEQYAPHQVQLVTVTSNEDSFTFIGPAIFNPF